MSGFGRPHVVQRILRPPPILVNGKEVPFKVGAAQVFRNLQGRGLYGSYQTAYDEARQANVGRYEGILGQYGALHTRAMGLLENLGDQERSDIRQRYAGREATGMQDLVSRGLSGTTLLPNLRMGVERDQSAELRRLGEGLRRERLGYDVGLTQSKLGFMERRTDAYPDYGQLMQLAMARGQGGAGSRVSAQPVYTGSVGTAGYHPGISPPRNTRQRRRPRAMVFRRAPTPQPQPQPPAGPVAPQPPRYLAPPRRISHAPVSGTLGTYGTPAFRHLSRIY